MNKLDEGEHVYISKKKKKKKNLVSGQNLSIFIGLSVKLNYLDTMTIWKMC